MKKRKQKLGQYISENHGLNPLTDEFLEDTAPIIGYIVHSFNSLEGQLNSAICELINDRTDEPGAIIIQKMSFSAKVDLFKRLVKSMELAFDRGLPSFNTFIENIAKCGRCGMLSFMLNGIRPMIRDTLI